MASDLDKLKSKANRLNNTKQLHFNHFMEKI